MNKRSCAVRANLEPRPSARVGQFNAMTKRFSRLRYIFDKMKRGRCYEKGSLPCLRASIFYRDTELLSRARYYSDKWRYLIVCYTVFRSLVKRIAHTRTLCFVLIGYVSLNGR